MSSIWSAVRHRLRTTPRQQEPVAIVEVRRPVILDSYVRSAPSPQNALDIFQGEWASRFPAPLAEARAGQVSLFEDPRIDWADKVLGGMEGKAILELGPLEAGHSYMLERLGASSISAVEANTRAYLKCLVAKELLGLQRTRFLCGDFIEYLRVQPPRFDVAIASGVLYHMRQPIELLALLSGVADRLLLWTHHYEPAAVAKAEHLRRRFGEHVEAEVSGFKHTLHRYSYLEALDSHGFCGGSAEYSQWLSRADILGALEHFGYRRIEIAFDDAAHPNGPAFAVAAQRE